MLSRLPLDNTGGSDSVANKHFSPHVHMHGLEIDLDRVASDFLAFHTYAPDHGQSHTAVVATMTDQRPRTRMAV